MNIGKLNRRITIQERATTRDAIGGVVETYNDIAKVWAELVVSNGQEQDIADAKRARETATFRIRHVRNLSAGKNRILYQMRFYNITAIIEEGIRNTLLIEGETVSKLTHI